MLAWLVVVLFRHFLLVFADCFLKVYYSGKNTRQPEPEGRDRDRQTSVR
jgi:hypothetical protein